MTLRQTIQTINAIAEFGKGITYILLMAALVKYIIS